ncbi:MAG: A/G-specific adenine glycosylase [Verrucomicrobia bacterium]|nr:A/G-specific adenine glycosylase [Verrucomicrobiota bacterium]
MPARATNQSSKFKVQGSKFPKRETGNFKLETRCARLAPPLLGWFARAARDLPWRRTLDPYAIWVSEIMLQQTQVKTVIAYYERWLRELPDLAAVAAAAPDKLHKLWEGLGYYTRVRNLQKAAQQIIREHNGKFPRDFDAVLALPGIGRYTAGAIASIAFNTPKPILDGNVMRVLCRLFAIRDNPRDKATNAKLWHLAELLVRATATFPNSKLKTQNSKLLLSGPCSALNQSLMELGATVCTPRSPACDACPLRNQCAAFQKNLTAQIPNLAARATATARTFHTFLVRRAGKYLVQQRTAGVVNAHLWEFPNLEATGTSRSAANSARELFKLRTARPRPFATIKHSITRYRITQEAFLLEVRATPKISSDHHRWLATAELHSLAFTSAHRKLLHRLAPQLSAKG